MKYFPIHIAAGTEIILDVAELYQLRITAYFDEIEPPDQWLHI